MLTKSELEKFIDGPVWKIFKEELQSIHANVMASILCMDEPLQIYRAQGRSEVLIDMIKWPEMQLEELD
jgi:hypothetical protein